MKKKSLILGMAILFLSFGLVFVGCDSGGGGGGGGGNVITVRIMNDTTTNITNGQIRVGETILQSFGAIPAKQYITVSFQYHQDFPPNVASLRISTHYSLNSSVGFNLVRGKTTDIKITAINDDNFDMTVVANPTP